MCGYRVGGVEVEGLAFLGWRFGFELGSGSGFICGRWRWGFWFCGYMRKERGLVLGSCRCSWCPGLLLLSCRECRRRCLHRAATRDQNV